jgi:virulence factor
MLELSTDYTWSSAEERLTVVTRKGVYDLRQMDTLTYSPKQKTVMGVPLEKVVPSRPVVQVLYGRNNFVPTMTNNQVVSQGFFNEINAFVEAVEGGKNNILTSPDQIMDTYHILDNLNELFSVKV